MLQGSELCQNTAIASWTRTWNWCQIVRDSESDISKSLSVCRCYLWLIQCSVFIRKKLFLEVNGGVNGALCCIVTFRDLILEFEGLDKYSSAVDNAYARFLRDKGFS